jgi:hypothetical protein
MQLVWGQSNTGRESEVASEADRLKLVEPDILPAEQLSPWAVVHSQPHGRDSNSARTGYHERVNCGEWNRDQG